MVNNQNTKRQTGKINNAGCKTTVALKHELGNFIFFVGKYIEEKERFEIQGIFSTEKKAIRSCRDRTYFVLPIKLNKLYPDRTIKARSSFYPIG